MFTCAFTLSAQEGLRDRDPTFSASKQIAADLNLAFAHSGPFYLLSRFQISDLGYSNELYLPVVAASKGLAFAVSAPQRLYFVPSRKAVYSLQATPTYAWIRKPDGGSQFGWTVRGDAQYLLNHVYLDVYAEAFNDLRVSNAEIDRVITERDRDFGARGEFKYSTRTSLLFTAIHRSARFPLDRFQPPEVLTLLPRLERTENDYRVALLHKTFPVTSLLLAAERNDYKFPNFSSRDAQRTYTGAGFVWDRGRERWHLEAGPTKLNFKTVGVKDYSGVTGNTDATFRVAERTIFNVAASRDLEFSVINENGYFVYDRAQASLGYLATRHLTLRLISEVGRDSYQIAVNSIFRRDEYSFNGVGWDYSARHAQGGFDVGYYRRTSNVADGEQSHGIRLLAHLSFTP
ncbi:MAG TPA: hypothetical protein VH087_15595 [Thermoanaerobaculia bacterium]|nr:hypothetical protein [Thermoanaerobaculia bacterium]